MTPNRRTFLRALGAGSIGTVATFSGTAAAATTVTVEGAGEDIWDAADGFHYYHEEVSGDFDVVVHNTALENTDSWAKAGLMVRQTLNADAENAMVRRRPNGEASLQWRSAAGADTVSTTSDGGSGESEVSGGSITADWLRLTRSGDTISAYGSTDGSNWTLIADIAPGEIDFAEDAYVGLAVTSHSAGTLSTAEFESLSGLSPSSNGDVGDVDVAGSVSTSDGGGGSGDGGSDDGGSGDDTSGGSYFDVDAGFADASWFDDSVTVHRVQEATESAVRAAFEASGPRLVVFEASGVVDLGGGDLSITNDKCWVAGQTAPSPGITFINGMIQVDANDCVVQHLRIFRGEDGGAAEGADPMNNADDTSNVIFDHCSAYWGRDENLSVGYNTSDTTFANCLVAEGLDEPEENSNGSLVGNGAQNVAILGTVYAANNDRNPRLKDDTQSVIANSIVYYFDKAIWASPGAQSSVVGNAYLGRFDWSDAIVKGDGSVYIEDNIVADPGLNGRTFCSATQLGSRPLWPNGLTAMPATDVESHNLAYAGARPVDRISHEQRVIDNIRNRSLDTDVSDPANAPGIPGDEGEVGGYPDHGGSTRSLSVPDSGLRDWVDQWALAVEESGASPP
ncbi:hypothetical protein DEQ92_13295 [Haloferax sp. Atlit-6N]|uniref:hypothetical protein n=1 Tax=Haloferax sp. Atlit-6N TaxID=2077205 RepID=UPI000E25B1DB|nr:hypothetical protein [Haloferax sp. Atlit-6N]REA02753.1 hypothetical protein DEQ92_13295 [Haloferax sp. Atlit-6N]